MAIDAGNEAPFGDATLGANESKTPSLSTEAREMLSDQYNRVCSMADVHLRETIEDWKTPGLMAATVAWIPLAQTLTDQSSIQLVDLLLWGFVAAAAIGVILGFRLILRLSLLYFLLDLAHEYEKELTKEERGVKNIAQWYRWEKQHHGPVVVSNVVCVLVFFFVLPSFTLYLAGGGGHVVIYLAVCSIMTFWFVLVAWRTSQKRRARLVTGCETAGAN